MTVFKRFKSSEHDPSRTGVAELLSLAVFLVLSLVLVAQILSRYLLNSPLGWTEEIARYLLIVLTFLGAAIGFRKGTHISFLYVLNLFPHKIKRIAGTVLSFLGSLFLIFLIYSAINIIPQLQHFELSSINISLSIFYWIVLAALVLCGIGSIQHLLHVARTRN